MSKYDDVKDKKKAALELLKGPRGHFIISRALDFLLERLKSVEGPLREKSDIDDMELLLNELFPDFGGHRSHMGKEVLKGRLIGFSPDTREVRLLTLAKGKKAPKEIIVADFFQSLRQRGGKWILETPMDPGADPQELTPEQARKWLLSTGPANAKLSQKYFPEGGK